MTQSNRCSTSEPRFFYNCFYLFVIRNEVQILGIPWPFRILFPAGRGGGRADIPLYKPYMYVPCPAKGMVFEPFWFEIG